MNTFTAKTQRVINQYGSEDCVAAYKLEVSVDDVTKVADAFSVTTKQAKRLIVAGLEIENHAYQIPIEY